MPASKTLKEIAINGAKIIKNGMTIFTYCYSTTVIAILQEAHNQDKKFQVICSETRPNFTGRLTAKALAKIGIPITITVDSMAYINLQKSNLFLFGADQLTDKFIINKIGTNMMAQLAKLTKTPAYCCTSTAKFRTAKINPKTSTINTRPLAEVWPHPPKNIIITNPAYDFTKLTDITGVIIDSYKHPF